MSAQPFRFLDLPAELRCMVYEAIDVATKKEKYKPTPTVATDKRRAGKLVMYRSVLPVSILASCRLINQEATPIMARKIQMIVREPVRFRLDWTPAEATQDILYSCFSLSPQSAYSGITLPEPMLRFIENCRSYIVEIARARPVNIAVADVEVTITFMRLRYHKVGFSRIFGMFYNICDNFGISLDMLLKENPTYNSRVHAKIGAHLGGWVLDNWRTKARWPSGEPEVRIHDMDSNEWAQQLQMLNEL